MNQKIISHEDFVKGYRAGELSVFVNKNKAGDFVMSDFADKHNKPAHLFYSWLGIILIIPLPIVLLLFRHWMYAILTFILGLVILGTARKSASSFVLKNMLENESFWDYVLLHRGAIIRDKDGNELTSAFLDRMR